MDAIKSMFSNSKAKANVSPDGGAPDTVGTAVAHRFPGLRVCESSADEASLPQVERLGARGV